MSEIKILTQFSESPGPRYCRQGRWSGEQFYHDILNQAFAEAYQNGDKLILDLDGTDGYMSSFLDEAIGNLVYDFGMQVVKDNLIVISREEPVWKKVIDNEVIPEWNKYKDEGTLPKKTSKKNHPAWFGMIDGKLNKKVWISSAT